MNTRYIFLAAGALVMSACSKDLTEEIVKTPGSAETMKITLTGQYGSVADEAGTRVAISGDKVLWRAGDAVGVFADASKKPAEFKITSGAGTATAQFEGEVGVEEGDFIYALSPYTPDEFGFDVNPAAAKITFNGQMQDGFGANAENHLSDYAYMAAKPAKVSGGKASMQFGHLAVKMSFTFALPEAVKVRFLTLSTASAKLYDKGVVDLTAASPAAKPWGTASRTLSMGFENANVAAGQTVTAHMMMMPVDLSSTEVTFYISAEKADGTPVTYTATKSKGLNFAAETAYTAEISSVKVYNTYIPMVYVPGGSLNICGIFEEDDEYNEAIVNRDFKVNSFWLSQTEVTNQQYCDFLNSRNPMDFQLSAWIDQGGDIQIEKKGGKWQPKTGPILNADGKTTHQGSYADYPMVCVSYMGANAYTAWVAEKMLGYNDQEPYYYVGRYMPSEMQWEYAAAGSEWCAEWAENLLAGGNDPDEVMWYCGNCDSEGSSCMGVYIGNGNDPNAMSGDGSRTGGTHPVGKLKPNYLGLYDMSGNVSEICSDWWVFSPFPFGNSLDPFCKDIADADSSYGEQYRAVRGGFWAGYAAEGITFYRDYITPDYTSWLMGFRMMLTLK